MITDLPLAVTSLSSLSCEAWIDIVSVAVVGVCMIRDAIKGLSATVATIAALIISFKISFSLCPLFRDFFSGIGMSSSTVFSYLPSITAIILLIILFFIFRFIFRKFISVIIPVPVDNILGALLGCAKGIMIIFAVFVVFSIVLGRSYASSPFAKSQTGTHIIPVVDKIIPNAIKAQDKTK